MGRKAVKKRQSGMWMDMWKQDETEILCRTPRCGGRTANEESISGCGDNCKSISGDCRGGKRNTSRPRSNRPKFSAGPIHPCRRTKIQLEILKWF